MRSIAVNLDHHLSQDQPMWHALNFLIFEAQYHNIIHFYLVHIKLISTYLSTHTLVDIFLTVSSPYPSPLNLPLSSLFSRLDYYTLASCHPIFNFPLHPEAPNCIATRQTMVPIIPVCACLYHLLFWYRNTPDQFQH